MKFIEFIANNKVLGAIFLSANVGKSTQFTKSGYAPVQVFIGSLRAIGQVAFVNSAITGAAILTGCAIERPLAAFLGFISAFIGTLFGMSIPGERKAALDGLHGYNGYLFGMGVGYFNYKLAENTTSWESFAILLPITVVGAVICFLINVAISKSISSPPFTFAYNIILSCWLAYATSLSGKSDFSPTFFVQRPTTWISYSQIDFGWFVKSTLAGIGQVYFSPELTASIIITGGLAIGSPIAALLAIIGSAVATGVAIVTHASITLAEEGVYGLSAVLGSIGLGGFYFYFSWSSVGIAILTSIFCVIMTPLLAGLFVRPFGPAMTFPFCFSATFIFIACKILGRPILVPQDILESPEAHLMAKASTKD
jgi:urea transporter